jgi:uncharacterized BrkB/YihY/UPF0761 family membrane protein
MSGWLILISYDTAMRLIRNPQLWLSLGKEIWERNRGQNLKQIAASLAFTTTLSMVPMVTIATMLIGYLPSVIQVKNAFKTWLLDTYMPGGINQQVFVYLDQFSSQAKGLSNLGAAFSEYCQYQDCSIKMLIYQICRYERPTSFEPVVER